MDIYRPKDSSNIVSARYLPSIRQVFIDFKGGERYQVSQVPLATWEAFKKDVSAGKFFHQVLKRNYVVRKLEDREYIKSKAEEKGEGVESQL